MKIAIISLIPCENYGGIMQSYALQTTLSRLGHEVTIISKTRKQEVLGAKRFFIYPWRLFKKYILHDNINVRQNDDEKIRYNKNEDIRCRDIYPFLNKYLHIEYIRRFSEINSHRFDAIIVGSDQVWRPRYFEQQYKEHISNAFLSFAKGWNLRRYSYAASFGTEVWEYNKEDTLLCSELISLFDKVSVRESSGVTLCKQHLGVKAVKLIDPTFLLSQKDYISLIQDNETIISQGNLLVYLLDESEMASSLIDIIANDEKLKPFTTNVAWTDRDGTAITKPSVQSWIRGFMDAKFVVTDSYHACIFSIIFNKPFVVFGNKERGMARFESLLTDFGLENHLLFNIEDYSTGSYLLDEFDIDSRLNILRKEAISFLTDIGE